MPISVVKYERLVDDTDATLRICLKALGFPDPDEDRFQFAMQQTSFDNLRRQEQATGFRETRNGAEFFRSGRVGQWRDDLSLNQRKRICNAFGEQMERWGYLDTNPD